MIFRLFAYQYLNCTLKYMYWSAFRVKSDRVSSLWISTVSWKRDNYKYVLGNFICMKLTFENNEIG